MVGTISTLGVGSGLQLQSIIDQLKTADKVPILQMETKKLQANDKISEFDTIKGLLLDQKDNAMTLSLASTYLDRNVSLTNSDPVAVTSNSGADIGSYNVNVVRLAQKSAFTSSQGFVSGDSYINSSGSTQVFSYTSDGKSSSLSVPTGTTLSQFASMINSDPNNRGVTASVVQQGSSSNAYKLSLQANTKGEQYRISVTSQLPSLTLTEETGTGGTSLDAEVKIDGVSYVRNTNQISDILDGVTFNLQSSGETSLSISTDTSAIGDRIKKFVDGLNKYIGEYNKNSSYDLKTGVAGSLTGVTSLSSFKSQLLQDVTSKVDTGGKITSLFDLGFEVNRDGTVKIDEKTLNKQLSENFNDVQEFLLGDDNKNITGWGDKVNNRLREAVRANTGILDTEKTASQTLIERLTQEISDSDARLNKRYDILANQFSQLDKYARSMQNMSNYLTQQTQSNSSSSTG